MNANLFNASRILPTLANYIFCYFSALTLVVQVYTTETDDTHSSSSSPSLNLPPQVEDSAS